MRVHRVFKAIVIAAVFVFLCAAFCTPSAKAEKLCLTERQAVAGHTDKVRTKTSCEPLRESERQIVAALTQVRNSNIVKAEVIHWRIRLFGHTLIKRSKKLAWQSPSEFVEITSPTSPGGSS